MKKLTILLIIYLIGYIISYYLLRKINRDADLSNFGENSHYSWDDVISNMFLSLLSWMIVGVICCIDIKNYLDNTKPPKWL